MNVLKLRTGSRKEIEASIREEKPDLDDRQFGIERRKRVSQRFPEWQQATVREINEMLERAMAAAASP